MSRELRLTVLVIALVLGSLTVALYAFHTPPVPTVSTADAAPLSAAGATPSAGCHRWPDGHFPQVGLLQSAPAELPCD
ncbi:MAG TPA: hypothetical protein VFE37_20115 [Chloroflexota bacterium]|nr:hypothetical protein [Chloroflexota bacterium]